MRRAAKEDEAVGFERRNSPVKGVVVGDASEGVIYRNIWTSAKYVSSEEVVGTSLDKRELACTCAFGVVLKVAEKSTTRSDQGREKRVRWSGVSAANARVNKSV
ncbi:hypothetical protein AC1031_005522 [Aphanomyces cochlioides]|nr:hypothetical protein AC1031_005522 [Aphanomyces cochlioides]